MRTVELEPHSAGRTLGMVDVMSNLQIQQVSTSLKKSSIHRTLEKMRAKCCREVVDSYTLLPQFLHNYSDHNTKVVMALQVDDQDCVMRLFVTNLLKAEGQYCCPESKSEYGCPNVASFIENVSISTPNKDNDNMDGPSGSHSFIGSHGEDVVEGRRLSERNEITLYCDEDQLASLLLSHFSFPKSIRGEMVEIVELDQVGDCKEKEMRYKICKYISQYKSRMMHESTKRFSSSSIDSTTRVHGEDMETIQTIMHEYFLEEPPQDVRADHTIVWCRKL